MLTANVPDRLCSWTVSCSGVLDTSSMARFMYLYSVACWKYLDWVILSTRRSSLRDVDFPPLEPNQVQRDVMGVEICIHSFQLYGHILSMTFQFEKKN